MLKFDEIGLSNFLKVYKKYISVDTSINVIRFKDIEFNEIEFNNKKITYNTLNIDYTKFEDNKTYPFFNLYFDNCNFKEILKFCNIANRTIRFENCYFKDIIFEDFFQNPHADNKINAIFLKNINKVNNITVKDCEFYGKFYINKQYDEPYDKKLEINKLSITGTEFRDNFKLHNCEINEIELKDTDFEKNADFYLSHFKSGIKKDNTTSEINFKALNFRGLALFGDTIFDKKFNLQYVTVEGYSHFRKAEFEEGLDLDYVNIQNEMNFFGVKKLDSNISKDNTSQETYRIIKHNFEKLGNKIEANKYHALELEQRKKVLENEPSKNWKEYLVFKIHELSSEHSTNWLLSLSWIVIVGILTTIISKSWLALFCLPLVYILYKLTYIVSNIKVYNITLVGIMLFVLSILNIEDNFKNMALINLTNSYFIFIGDVEKNELNTWQVIVLFFNKISLGYLYYQFLMSVRKDTRK